MRKLQKISIIAGILLIVVIGYAGYLRLHYEVPILMYHSLDASRVDSYAAVSPEHFREQLQFIKQGGYKVMPLEEYCSMLKDGRKPPRKSVVITFDDGHKDNLAAAELLEEFGFPATVFIIANKLGRPGYLSREDVKLILRDEHMAIGSHTLNEVYLPDASEAVLRREITGSRKKLEEIFGRDINTFSYTIGGFNEVALREVQDAGYICACTTNRGYDRKPNRFALRRIKINDGDTGFGLMAKLSGHYNLFRKPKKPY